MINASEIRQVKRDLEDIVQVWAVVEYRPTDSLLEREMLMVKVPARPLRCLSISSSSSSHHPHHPLHPNCRRLAPPMPPCLCSARLSSPLALMALPQVNANPPGVNDGNPVFAGGAASRYQQSAADIIAVNATRQSIVELTKLFGGKILDLTNETVTIELTAKQARVDAFLKLGAPLQNEQS